jgi:hypothetical protein
MKKLITLVAAFAFATTGASAQITFDPTFDSSGGIAAQGYTTTLTDGSYTTGSTDQNDLVTYPLSASITYSAGQLTASDSSGNGEKSFISRTSTAPNPGSFNTTLTFTPSYSVNSANGNQGATTVLDVFDGGNGPLLSINFQSFGFGNNGTLVNVSSGVDYGTSDPNNPNSTTGTSSLDSHPFDSLNGVPVTVNLTTTLTYSGTDPQNGYQLYTVTNVGTISAGGNTANIDSTTIGASYEQGYDPFNTPLTLDLGIVSEYDDNSADGTFIGQGESVSISSALVTTAPEPSTVALMLGGLGLLMIAVRRRLSA